MFDRIQHARIKVLIGITTRIPNISTDPLVSVDFVAHDASTNRKSHMTNQMRIAGPMSENLNEKADHSSSKK